MIGLNETVFVQVNCTIAVNIYDLSKRLLNLFTFPEQKSELQFLVTHIHFAYAVAQYLFTPNFTCAN